MKILFLANLDWLSDIGSGEAGNRRPVFETESNRRGGGRRRLLSLPPEGCLSPRLARDLRRSAIVLALGNRDYYLTEDWAETQSREWPGFLRLRRYWKESCVDNRIVLLDDENLDLGELVVASGYGHYDLGFAVPGFSRRGTPVTEEHYTYGSIQRRMRRSEDQARHPWD